MVKKILYLSLKKKLLIFEGLLVKIKSDLIKFLLNLNIVISNNEDRKENKKIIPENKPEKKLEEMKNVLVALGKNLNIAM